MRALLLRNVKDGYSGLLGQSYCYIAPALKPYPFQWFWDTCFHVIMLARLGEHDLAKRNLRSLFAMQEENGFVGHMIFWKQVLPKRRMDVMQARPSWHALRPHMSALIQPTFAAIALPRAVGGIARPGLPRRDVRARQALPRMAGEEPRPRRRWPAHHHQPRSSRAWTGRPHTIRSSATASGSRRRGACTRARSTGRPWAWISATSRAATTSRASAAGARFLVKDAGSNAIYALDLECMEKLAPLAGDDPAPYAQRRKRVAASLMEKMNDGAHPGFYDLHEPGARKLRILTPTIFFPLAVAEVDQDVAARIVAAHFSQEHEFAAPFPLPSVEMRDGAFYPRETPFIWRGPSWAVINWFLYHALKKRGFTGEAAKLRSSLWTLVEKSGFREYYDPFTGAGYGAREFTWSGLLLDME